MRIPPCGCEGIKVGHFSGVDGGGGGTVADMTAFEAKGQVAECGWTNRHR